ncbi:hypothetical protein F5972_35575 [Microbispora cellulosiformans]|uniref:CN hydrolase domain-containing protein n=1 Tax=Microbispora cellulosiformans TaxID=2614688 RepID=A0A5J5JTW8_9ACTN|nr:nitrilase-related carbon-nitrogen hydrolase [Microbispora cellulosiformans]KAA9373390.1 hypothetical protein F5972_35575 [Microbispora cellulosiformans]
MTGRPTVIEATPGSPRTAVTRVAVAQVAPRVGEPAANRAAAEAAITDAAGAGARLVVLPELVNSGYVFTGAEEARSLAEPADGPTVTGWERLAGADRCADERGMSWVRGTSLIGPDGYPLAGPVLTDGPAVLTADCDLTRARDKATGPRNDVHRDRRTDLY